MDLTLRADAIQYIKKLTILTVQFAAKDQVIDTLEGPVRCEAGDAIVNGTVGERWPVPKDVFFSKYAAVPPTRNGESGQYQSLPKTVLAVQIQVSTKIELSGGRGTLTGAAGDWVVQYAPGDCSIIRNDIFRNTYERAHT